VTSAHRLFTGSMTNTLWVVSPVYFDVAAFLEVRRRVRDHLTPLEWASRVRLNFLVVDDSGHEDRDMAVLEGLNDVLVLQAPFNLGHQGAIVLGLRSLSKHVEADDWIVTMDADGEDLPADLPRLLAALADLPAGSTRVVLACRVKRQESWPFKVLYAGFKLVFRILTGMVIRTGNFAAFRGAFAKQAIFHRNFDLSYSSALVSLRGAPIYVPCERGRRVSGQSRMGFAALFRHGLRMLMPFSDRVATRGLVAFTLLLAMGVATLGVMLWIRMATEYPVPPWAWYSLLALVTISCAAVGSSITLFMLFAQSEAAAFQHLQVPHLEGAAAKSLRDNASGLTARS